MVALSDSARAVLAASKSARKPASLTWLAKTAGISEVRASNGAAAIASAQPHGAQLIAWVKYAQDGSANRALLRELLLEAARWPESVSLAKRQQLRTIIAVAFAEWLAPKACTDCGGQGVTFVRGEDGAMTEHDCLPCGGSGRVPMSDNRRAENCGVDHKSWRERLNGDRAHVYERAIITLRRWDGALLATVAEAMRAVEIVQ